MDPTPIFAELTATWPPASTPTAGGRHRWRTDTPSSDPPTEEMPRVPTSPVPPPYIRFPRAATSGYTARQVAKAYGMPLDRYDGTGITIGVIELGGGFNPGDMTQAGLTNHVTTVAIAGGGSKSDGPNGADGEVMLDIEVIAGVAPGAAQRVYFCPNTDVGFLAGIAQASTECDVISISWGSAESQWDPRSIAKFSAAFKTARAKGVPVFVAAGDSGSRDGTRTDVTDYPASDPSVIGCGGTRLTLDSSGARAAEVTWDDDDTRSATGGGVSKVFAGRSVPDVAGNASPVSGYQVVVDGQGYVIGGTSAVAPLYAAGYALLRQAYGRPFDLLNTILTNPAVCFDVTVGDNGGFKAGPGRDNVTGYGVVDMGKLLAILTSGTQIPAPGGGTGGTVGTTTTGGAAPTTGALTAALQQIEATAKAALAG